MINFGYNVLNCLFCNYYKRYKIENQANFKLRYQDWKKEKRIKEAKKIVDLKKVKNFFLKFLCIFIKSIYLIYIKLSV